MKSSDEAIGCQFSASMTMVSNNEASKTLHRGYGDLGMKPHLITNVNNAWELHSPTARPCA